MSAGSRKVSTKTERQAWWAGLTAEERSRYLTRKAEERAARGMVKYADLHAELDAERERWALIREGMIMAELGQWS